MFQSIKLRNGIKVVTEEISQFRSVSVGIWFKNGSIFESDVESGISHFIEHMLFKGTKTRSAKEIADLMDGIGGQLNAFTAKEYTCFYFKVLDEHLDKGLDLLSDMILNSNFDSGEIEKEKGVIFEEILMYEDSPEDLSYDLLSDAMFKGHPLSKPILGTRQTLENLDRDKLLSFYRENYSPETAVISIAGKFDEKILIESLEKYFGCWEAVKSTLKNPPKLALSKQSLFRYKDIEQTHIYIGYPGISLQDDTIYSLFAFNNLFGGSMSSRLFQKIREDKGLVYSVLSHPSNYTVGGIYAIYASMKSSNASEVVEIIKNEICDVLDSKISKDELLKAKEQLKGNYILGLESTSSRMNSLGKSELLLNKITNNEEILDKINSITFEDIVASVKNTFSDGPVGLAIIGKEDISDQIGDIIDI